MLLVVWSHTREIIMCAQCRREQLRDKVVFVGKFKLLKYWCRHKLKQGCLTITLYFYLNHKLFNLPSHWQKRRLNVEYLTMDASVLLQPTNTPLTGIEFTKRLPCGEVERVRKVSRDKRFHVLLCSPFCNILVTSGKKELAGGNFRNFTPLKLK